MSTRNPQHRRLLLWTALLLPALAWFAQLSACYTIATYACAHDQMWILHAISVAAVVLTVIGLWSAWRVLASQRDDSGQEAGWLARATLWLAVLFLLGVLATEMSNWLLVPCV